MQIQLGALLPDKINFTIKVSGLGEALWPCRLDAGMERNISLNREKYNKQIRKMDTCANVLCVKPTD